MNGYEFVRGFGLDLLQYFVNTPFVVVATFIKSYLFSLAFVNIIAAILIPLGLRSVAPLVNNIYVKVFATLLCFYA